MPLPDSVQKYTEYAVEQFIQTVVFVDDRIYRPVEKAAEPTKVVEPSLRKRAIKEINAQVSQDTLQTTREDRADDDEYSPYQVVGSFAKKNIICALFQPKRDVSYSDKSEIYRLCSAADIVIVDWDLYGDHGHKASELVAELISAAVNDTPEQLRLLLIYTQEANLFGITDQLITSVRSDVPAGPDSDGLGFQTQNTRVTILGKTGRERAAACRNHEVEERQLAERAVQEFGKLASGIMHAAALMGLASIRQNSRKVLSKFSSELDPAFLTHRAMSLPEDASDHIIPMLMAEIESVLEDVLPRPLVTDQIISDWCTHWTEGGHVRELLNNVPNSRQLAIAFCMHGRTACKDHSGLPNLDKKKNVRLLSKLLLNSAESSANYQFSRLLSSRTYYRAARKTLELGCIVFSQKKREYLLCLQPVCDSIRLTGKTTFMFAKLAHNDVDRVAHVVLNGDDFVELAYSPKPSQCCAVEFSPARNMQRVMTKLVNGQDYFTDRRGVTYLWVDQLKPAHAQRAAESFARELSRVGLTESEWIRRLERHSN